MKTIYLVRHAKASQDRESFRDWERPLTPAGIKRAGKIGKKLYRIKIRPERMISSHAFRALNTAIIFAQNMKYPVTAIEISPILYEKVAPILALLKKQDDSISSIMLFGHNPSISNLCNYLAKQKIEDLPTSGVACIELKISKWSNIAKYAGQAVFIETGTK